MARNQKNFKYQKYVDDQGGEWSLMSESGGALDGVDGHAAFDATKPAFGRATVRRHPRYVVYKDATTFRTVKGVVFTAAAYAAIDAGDVVAVQVAGLATTVNYTVSRKIGEKMPLPQTSRNLADA